MGNRASSTNTVNIDTSTTINKMTNTMVSSSQSNYQQSTNFQFATIENQGVVNGNIRLDQKIDVNQQQQANITQDVVQQLQNDIKSGIEAELDQAAKSKSGLLTVGSSANSRNITTVKDAFNATINDVITVENVQKTVNETTNLQDGKIINKGVINKDLIIDQKIIVRLVSINVINQVFNQVNKYLQDNKSNVKVEQEAQTTVGADWTDWIFIAIICVVSCCCSMLLVFMLPQIIGSGADAYATVKTGGASKALG